MFGGHQVMLDAHQVMKHQGLGDITSGPLWMFSGATDLRLRSNHAGPARH